MCIFGLEDAELRASDARPMDSIDTSYTYQLSESQNLVGQGSSDTLKMVEFFTLYRDEMLSTAGA